MTVIQLSRPVLRRSQLCDLVLGATEIQTSTVSTALADGVNPFLRDGEVPPDFDVQIQLHARKLGWHRDRMLNADHDHRLFLTRAVKLRNTRDEQTRLAQDRLGSLRSLCGGVLEGESSLADFALDLQQSRAPATVLQHGEAVHKRLLGHEGELPSFWLDGLAPQDLAAKLGGDLELLRGTLWDLVKLQKQTDVAMLHRRSMIDEFNTNYIGIARLLEAMFRVAGHRDLADRIRPTVRQLREIPDDDEDDVPVPAQEAVPETSEASGASDAPVVTSSFEAAALNAAEPTSLEVSSES